MVFGFLFIGMIAGAGAALAALLAGWGAGAALALYAGSGTAAVVLGALVAAGGSGRRAARTPARRVQQRRTV